jgi:hypothetical protein
LKNDTKNETCNNKSEEDEEMSEVEHLESEEGSKSHGRKRAESLK